MHSVPVRVLLGKRPPLTARGHHIENRVHHPPPINHNRTAHGTRPPVRSDQISDQVPLPIRRITVGRPPRLRRHYML